MYINTESIVELENFRSTFGMIRARSGQNLIGMMLNLLSLLMQTGRSPQTSACFSFPLSQLPSKIASVSKTSPACYFYYNRHLKADSPITPHPSPNAAHTSQPYSSPSAFSPALPL